MGFGGVASGLKGGLFVHLEDFPQVYNGVLSARETPERDMGRRKEKGVDLIAALPWPVGIVAGIVAFVCVRYGLAWYLSKGSTPILQGLGRQFSNGDFNPIAWMVLALCWLGALLSYLSGRKRQQLLAKQSGLDSLRAMSWREFEMLVGEAFRRHGYSVEETGLGGADGGVDLILHKNGRKELAQCKQWRKTQVSVATVREMWGLATHHGADAVKIVCIGNFTADAAEFARGKPIELINGSRLMELVRQVQAPSSVPATPSRAARSAVIPTAAAPSATPADTSPTCPLCSSSMVIRQNKTNGQSFWGCSTFPRCRGTRAVKGVI